MGHTIESKVHSFDKVDYLGTHQRLRLRYGYNGSQAILPIPISPGPLVFIAVAAIVTMGTRWWWTPLDRSADSVVVTSGWFALLPREVLRLTHPGSVGKFAAGIFVGTVATNCRASVYGRCRAGGNYPELQADGKGERQREGCMPLLWRIIRFHGNPGNHRQHSHRQVSQPDAAHLGGIGGSRKLYGFESSRALLHRIWHFYLALAILGLLFGNPR